MKKNSLRRFICLVLIVFSIFTVSSCNTNRKNGCMKNKEYLESGYFLYEIHEYDSGIKKVYIMGLSELGKQQEVIVIPDKIDGMEVSRVGYHHWPGARIDGQWESENLKKVYAIFNYRNYFVYNNCPNLEEIYSLEGVGQSTDKLTVYYTGNTNVHFMDIYEGLYRPFWIEKKECMDKIDEPLINPEREGYVFKGWYKEEECINKWDFENDLMIETWTNKNGRYDYRNRLYLYAKWEKIQ